MWTIAEYGDPGYLEFWERLAPSLLTVTAGWMPRTACTRRARRP